MPLDLAAFARTRPYAYHLTSKTNLDSIRVSGRIDSATVLILKDGRKELLRRRRSNHKIVHVEGHDILLRDQAPLHEGNLRRSGEWSFADVVEALNNRVFFWPGTGDGPNNYGRRHFNRYLSERPVLIRVKTSELLDANGGSAAQFCRYNSGSPRYSGGRPSPRGPDTFLAAQNFDWSPSKVVELVFRDVATLPNSWEAGNSPDGPWDVPSGVQDVPSNIAMEPTALENPSAAAHRAR